MRTEEQMATIVARATKDLHLDFVKKWGFPDSVIAGSTFVLGVTLMLKGGYTEEQIVETARSVVAALSGAPVARGSL